MATTTITSASNLLKPVKQQVGGMVPSVNAVTVKAIQFTVPTGGAGSGYYTGDTLKIASFIPAGTKILGAYWKATTSQGATLTLKLQNGSGDLMTAANLTATSMAEITLTGNTFTNTENDLNIVLAGTTVGMTAATITLSFIMARVDAESTVTTVTV